MNPPKGTRILLGISGGIAAYKSCELTRLLVQAGYRVQVVMTPEATAFVTPLTLQVLSGQPVRLELLDPAGESAMSHIRLARDHELILIAPATAHFLARLRAGWADDLLTTLCLAAEVPIVVAPAMNQAMWQNPATRDNIEVLESRGIRCLGPTTGLQACGESGPGRMLEPPDILQALQHSASGRLAGLSVLISAGPTHEPLDPVRFIGNRSSGKMGYALARAARLAGARVTLVSGPVALTVPAGVQLIPVETAADMHAAVMAESARHQIYIGAAAVADFTPDEVKPHKIKKTEAGLMLSLRKTTDILASVARLDPPPFTVGFAAETEDMAHYARRKREAKGVDMVAGNRVGGGEGGFGSDDNALYVCWHGGDTHFPLMPKQQLAERLVTLIAEHYHAKNSPENSR
jgi:phosphopantothenoylcysteine decarboxylase/phosphopantothenate--cysteine ligase